MQLDEDLTLLGAEFQCPAELLRGVPQMLSRDDCDPLRWQEERVLRQQLRGRLHDVCEAVAELRKKVGARQLVRGHQPAGAAPSGTRGRHTPVWRTNWRALGKKDDPSQFLGRESQQSATGLLLPPPPMGR